MGAVKEKTVGDFSGRSQNLGFLKLIATILVIYGHAYSVQGRGADWMSQITQGRLTCGTVAVAFFFFASGFYVTKSLLKRQNGRNYFKARGVKIYPAFLFVMLLTVFVLGPLVTEVGVPEYFSSTQTYLYLLYLLMIPRYSLPGVFQSNPISIVNGSLWTLILEVVCYIGLFTAWKMDLLKKEKLKWINLVLVAAVLIIFGLRPAILYQYSGYLRPFFVFVVGMEFYVFRDEIKLNVKNLGISAAVGAVLLFFGYADLFVIVPFAYLISMIVFSKKQVSVGLGKWGDYSYAIYLTAFPIQQVLEHYMPGKLSATQNTVITVSICVVLSLIIYHCVEVPCARHLNKKR